MRTPCVALDLVVFWSTPDFPLKFSYFPCSHIKNLCWLGLLYFFTQLIQDKSKLWRVILILIVSVLVCSSGGAGMVVDLTSSGEHFHTVPTHVCTAPGIKTDNIAQVWFEKYYCINIVDKYNHLTWCSGHEDSLLPSLLVPDIKLMRYLQRCIIASTTNMNRKWWDTRTQETHLFNVLYIF